jgi:hypothetical protein
MDFVPYGGKPLEGGDGELWRAAENEIEGGGHLVMETENRRASFDGTAEGGCHHMSIFAT